MKQLELTAVQMVAVRTVTFNLSMTPRVTAWDAMHASRFTNTKRLLQIERVSLKIGSCGAESAEGKHVEQDSSKNKQQDYLS